MRSLDDEWYIYLSHSHVIGFHRKHGESEKCGCYLCADDAKNMLSDLCVSVELGRVQKQININMRHVSSFSG